MYAYTQLCHSAHTQTHTGLYKHLDWGEAAETVIKETGDLGATESCSWIWEEPPQGGETERGIKSHRDGLWIQLYYCQKAKSVHDMPIYSIWSG